MLSVVENVNKLMHTYSHTNQYALKIEDKLSTLCAVFDSTNHALQESLVEISTLGQNIVRLEERCFHDCSCLTVANGTGNLKEIGPSCFISCTSLSVSNLFDGSIPDPIRIIDDSAFRHTGFSELTVNLKGGESNSDSNMGSYAFANCQNLKKLTFIGSNYIGPYGFASCDNLNNVNFNNKYSYMDENCFDSCQSLESIRIPQKFHLLTDQMFNHCHSLKNIEFADPSNDPSHVGALGASCFNDCPNLTSIVLPSSINSLFMIDDNAFHGSSLRQVTFNGLNDDVFNANSANKTNGTAETTTVSYKKGKWIGNDVTKSNYQQMVQDAKSIISRFSDKADMTTVVILNTRPETCSRCVEQDKNVWSTDKFKSFQADSNTYWIYINSSNDQQYRQKFYIDISNYKKKLLGDDNVHGLPILEIFSYDTNGNFVHKVISPDNNADDNNYKDADHIISYIKSVSTASGETVESGDSTTATLSKAITGWGLSNDCVFISKSGTSYQWKYNSEGQQNTLTYDPAEKIDMTTTDNFKYGIWYYRIDKLIPYADSHHIPVFIEVGSAKSGCTPCIQFLNSVYKNLQFQQIMKSYPCMLAHIDYDKTDDPQVVYAASNLYNLATNQYGPPHVIFHWNKPDGTTVNVDKHFDMTDIYPGQLSSVDDVTTQLAVNFNGAQKDNQLSAPAFTTVSLKYTQSANVQPMQLTSDTSFKTTARVSKLSSQYKSTRPYYKALNGSIMTTVTCDIGDAELSIHCECKDNYIQVNSLSVSYIDILAKKKEPDTLTTDYANIIPLSAYVWNIDSSSLRSYDVPRIKYYIEQSGTPSFSQDNDGRYFICDNKTEDKARTYQLSTYDTATKAFGSTISISSMMPFNQPLTSSTWPYKQGWYQYYTTLVNETYYDREGILFKTDNITLTSQLTSNDFSYSANKTLHKLSTDADTSATYSTLSSATLASSKSYSDEEVQLNALDYNKHNIYNCDGHMTIDGKAISTVKVWLSGDNVIHATCINSRITSGVAKLYRFQNTI